MNDKFDPAPYDKHADNPKAAATNVDAALDAGLVGSFPASDAVSVLQPAVFGRGRPDTSLWQRIASIFR